MSEELYMKFIDELRALVGRGYVVGEKYVLFNTDEELPENISIPVKSYAVFRVKRIEGSSAEKYPVKLYVFYDSEKEVRDGVVYVWHVVGIIKMYSNGLLSLTLHKPRLRTLRELPYKTLELIEQSLLGD